MSLQALKIVKEEIARAKAYISFSRHALLETLEVTIVKRIEAECIEQPPLPLEPRADLCIFCRRPRDKCWGKSDPIYGHDFKLGTPTEAVKPDSIELKPLERCHCGEEADDHFKVTEAPGDVGYEDLCNRCCEDLRRDGLTVELTDRVTQSDDPPPWF